MVTRAGFTVSCIALLQGHSYEDIQEAVEEFVVTFNPPLEPALYGSAFETQISLSDDPPDYSSANKVLKVSSHLLVFIACVSIIQ